MSGPITQTSPDTECRVRQDKVRKKHPQPSPRKKTETPRAETPPTRKLGKHQEVDDLPPPKVQENVKKTIYRVQREAPLVKIRDRDTLYPWTGLPMKSVLVGTHVCCLLRDRKRAALSFRARWSLRAKLVVFHLTYASQVWKIQT